MEPNEIEEFSLKGELTGSGIKLSIRSRFLDAIERLGTSVVDRWTARNDAEVSLTRAKTVGARKLIEKIVELGVERLDTAPEYVEKVLLSHFDDVLTAQANTDAVIQVAAEELRSETEQSPGASTSAGGTSRDAPLSDGFLNRFKSYSSEATTEELRQRWGKILASEVRKPGTFSPKALRLIEELEADTAEKFEQVAAARFGGGVPRCLVEMTAVERVELVSSGLMADSGLLGMVLRFEENVSDNGEALWTYQASDLILAVPKGAQSRTSGENAPISFYADGPSIKVYVLTKVGEAIADILPDHREEVFFKFAQMIANAIKPSRVLVYRIPDSGDPQLEATLNGVV